MIEVKPEYEAIAIRINGLLHLWIDRRKFLGLRSWIQGGWHQYYIEFTMTDGVIIADYDSREKWEAILKQIEPILVGR